MCSPLLREQGVGKAVHPAAVAVQRVGDGVGLATHAKPLHQSPRRLIGRETLGRHPADAEVFKADAHQFADRSESAMGRNTKRSVRTGQLTTASDGFMSSWLQL